MAPVPGPGYIKKIRRYLKIQAKEIVKVNTKIVGLSNWLLEYTKKDQSLMELIASFQSCQLILPPEIEDDGSFDLDSSSAPGITGCGTTGVAVDTENGSGTSDAATRNSSSDFETTDPGGNGSCSIEEEPQVGETSTDARIGSEPTNRREEGNCSEDSDDSDIKPHVLFLAKHLESFFQAGRAMSTDVKVEASENSCPNIKLEREESEPENRTRNSASTDSSAELLALRKPNSVTLEMVNVPQNDEAQIETSRSLVSPKKNKNTPTIRKKKFRCTTCNKHFPRNSELVRHHRVHTGERPFHCGICGKCFKQKPGLERHFRIHTDEKPFRCHVCHKCFNQKSNLDDHLFIHTGEKPFVCETCGKRFRIKSSLKVHAETHSGEKTLHCQTCGKRFNLKRNVIRHQKRCGRYIF